MFHKIVYANNKLQYNAVSAKPARRGNCFDLVRIAKKLAGPFVYILGWPFCLHTWLALLFTYLSAYNKTYSSMNFMKKYLLTVYIN